MGMFDDIRKSLIDLVTALPRINRQNRKEIREVILQLQSELERSLTLAILYLDGVSRIKPKKELLDYLYSAPVKLMDTYNEFKVCAGLYGLADRFRTVFSSIKGSIPVGQISSVEWLIRDLARGESTVIGRLRGLTHMLADEGRSLEKLKGAHFDVRKKHLYQRVELEKKELKNRITWLAKTTRQVLSKLDA